MILSHHGKMEFGSPVLPKLQEAEVLYLVDNLDARLKYVESRLSHRLSQAHGHQNYLR